MKNKKTVFSDFSHDFVPENGFPSAEEVAKTLGATIIGKSRVLSGDLRLFYELKHPGKKILSVNIGGFGLRIDEYLDGLQGKISEDDKKYLLNFAELHQAFIDGKGNSVYGRCIDSIKLKYPEYCKEITKILYNK